MQFYKRKSTIQAIQWNGKNTVEVLAFVGKSHPHPEHLTAITISDGLDTFTAIPGDWIVKWKEGQFYPLDNEEFNFHYAPIAA